MTIRPSRPNRLICIAASLIVMLAAIAMRVDAQQTGAITGTVTDSAGAALPKATIVLHRKPGSFSRQTSADTQGHFNFDDLAPGDYNLRAEAAGFATGAHDLTVVPGEHLTQACCGRHLAGGHGHGRGLGVRRSGTVSDTGTAGHPVPAF
jgi:hypothetical protein